MKIGKVLFWVAQNVNQRGKTPSFCFVSKITSTTSHLFMTVCHSKKRSEHTHTKREAECIHQTKAQKKNYDAIKFINNKTLSTFPWNKFDDDKFYQRTVRCAQKKPYWLGATKETTSIETERLWNEHFAVSMEPKVYADVCDVCQGTEEKRNENNSSAEIKSSEKYIDAVYYFGRESSLFHFGKHSISLMTVCI